MRSLVFTSLLFTVLVFASNEASAANPEEATDSFTGFWASQSDFSDDWDMAEALAAVCRRKTAEQQSNEKFYQIAIKDRLASVREEWRTLFTQQSTTMASLAQTSPTVDLSIAGVQLRAYDLSNTVYAFLEHTTAFTTANADLIRQYY